MISVERIDELKAEVGAEDFGEIVALFLSEADAILESLGSVRSPAEAEPLLHALKGSALNLGFDNLAQLCREGQDGEIPCPVWDARVARIREVYALSKVRLAALP